MKIHYRMKRTTKQYIIVAFICIIVIGGAALFTAFIITSQIKEEYQTLLNDAYYEMEVNKKSVYIASADIMAGEAITKDNIKRGTVYSSQPQGSYLTEKEIGKQALIDITVDTQVLTAMVTDNTITSELREMQYEVININSNIISNDTVDIRIIFPNGESFIVLSKKVMKGIEAGSVSCYLWLDEEEILRMSAAIVDAALYGGARLITTKYIEPTIQEESIITYTPSLAILSLLESNPNILERCSQELNKEVRKSLENRQASSMATDVTQISWDIHPNRQSTEVEAISVPEEEAKDKSVVEEQTSKSDVESNILKDKELSSIQEEEYVYYTEEERAKDGDIEYGE